MTQFLAVPLDVSDIFDEIHDNAGFLYIWNFTRVGADITAT